MNKPRLATEMDAIQRLDTSSAGSVAERTVTAMTLDSPGAAGILGHPAVAGRLHDDATAVLATPVVQIAGRTIPVSAPASPETRGRMRYRGIAEKTCSKYARPGQVADLRLSVVS